MSKRIVFDEPYAGDESVVGTHKLMPDPLADQLIAAGMAHLAGSKEDAEAQAERDHKAAVKRNAEKEAKALEYAKNGDPKHDASPVKETRKQRKAREKAEKAAAAGTDPK
jgi:hypothetical protein